MLSWVVVASVHLGLDNLVMATDQLRDVGLEAGCAAETGLQLVDVSCYEDGSILVFDATTGQLWPVVPFCW